AKARNGLRRYARPRPRRPRRRGREGQKWPSPLCPRRMPALLRGEQALTHQILGGGGGIREQRRKLFAFGLGEGREHEIGGVLATGRASDADAHAREVGGAERGLDVAQAVVS